MSDDPKRPKPTVLLVDDNAQNLELLEVYMEDLSEVRVITARSHWRDEHESWPDYAQRRLRQLARHYGADNIAVADPGHPDAWIVLQVRPPSGS